MYTRFNPNMNRYEGCYPCDYDILTNNEYNNINFESDKKYVIPGKWG